MIPGRVTCGGILCAGESEKRRPGGSSSSAGIVVSMGVVAEQADDMMQSEDMSDVSLHSKAHNSCRDIDTQQLY